MNRYTQQQCEYVLAARLRERRPTPWPIIATGMGLQPSDGTKLKRLVWGIATGYGEPALNPEGAEVGRVRRVWVPTAAWVNSRAGAAWGAEDARLLALARGEGQARMPPVTAAYFGLVVGRALEEVVDRWTDPTGLGRAGFGLGRKDA